MMERNSQSDVDGIGTKIGAGQPLESRWAKASSSAPHTKKLPTGPSKSATETKRGSQGPPSAPRRSDEHLESSLQTEGARKSGIPSRFEAPGKPQGPGKAQAPGKPQGPGKAQGSGKTQCSGKLESRWAGVPAEPSLPKGPKLPEERSRRNSRSRRSNNDAGFRGSSETARKNENDHAAHPFSSHKPHSSGPRRDEPRHEPRYDPRHESRHDDRRANMPHEKSSQKSRRRRSHGSGRPANVGPAQGDSMDLADAIRAHSKPPKTNGSNGEAKDPTSLMAWEDILGPKSSWAEMEEDYFPIRATK